jgi:enoyl-CoA hydratase/carnithine racemase
MFLAAIELGDRETIDEFIRKIHRVIARFERLDVPVPAVIEGFALAGGLEVLLACDLRLASTEATIGDRHANYGLVASGSGTQRLVRQIGTARANDLMCTSRCTLGAEATNWSLVSWAVPLAEPDAA